MFLFLQVFDYDKQIWKWHSSTIKEASLESNVAILLSASISNLSLETQHLLQLAACIGTHFTSQMLALLTNKKQFDIEELLWEPLKEGNFSKLREELIFCRAHHSNCDSPFAHGFKG